MSARPRTIAIVLAGGRSSRFGGLKLEAELEGVTILEHAIRAVAGLADEIVVAGPMPRSDRHTIDRPAGIPVRFVADAEPFAGPLAALAGALRGSAADRAIVVGGDMPRLVPTVLGSMLQRLESGPDIDAVFLAGATPSAHRQVLPLALRVAPAAKTAAEAVDAGDRSLVRFLERLRTYEIPAPEWLLLDPIGRTLLDVDERSDLERWQADEIR